MNAKQPDPHPSPAEIVSSYQRAALLYRDVLGDSKVTRNTTVVPHWIENGNYFWYRRETKTGVQFCLVEVTTASKQAAFDHQALAAALAEDLEQEVDADNLPITNVRITLSPLKITFTAFDKRYRFDGDTSQIEAINREVDSDFPSKLLSPDGQYLAFSRDYNLWIQDLQTGEERALTTDGEQYYAYARSPQSWGSQIAARVLQARWSPDSKRLFTYQIDNRQVKPLPFIEHVPQDGSVRPRASEVRCALPGDQHIEEQHLVAIEVATSVVQRANYRPVPINRFVWGLFMDNQGWWGKDSRNAYFVELERGSRVARVVEFDTHTGSTRVLFKETAKTFLNLHTANDTCAALTPVPETDELIWFSERSGWAHLYLYDLKTGDCKHPITQGDWLVRDILHFDAEKREFWFQSAGRVSNRDPYYLDICRVNIDTGDIITVASSDDEYKVFSSLSEQGTIPSMFAAFYCNPENRLDNMTGISPCSRYLITTRSRADTIPVSLLLDRNGEVVMEVETADISGLPNGWQWPEPVKLLAADGKTDIYGVVFRPSDFSPDKCYPVIDSSFCVSCGHLPMASKGSFSNGSHYLAAAALAELGFIVVSIDGRGTACREKSFIDAGYGWLPSGNLAEDRIGGIQQLAQRYPYMDLNRVGIIGQAGSIGAIYGLVEHPEFYQVGVSHGAQDTRLMCSTHGELCEGLNPLNDKHPYAEQQVDKLRGKLLLVNNQLDKKTTPATLWRLVDALAKANKDFDLLMLPSNDGGSGHHGSKYYVPRRTWDYFIKHLQGVEPPREFDLSIEVENP